MQALDWLVTVTRSISRYSIWGAGFLLIASTFYVAAEVIFRKVGLFRITGATEIGGFMLAISSVWAFSWAVLNRANIRLDAFYLMLGSRGRAWLDLAALVALGAFAATVAYYAYGVLATSIRLNSQSISGLQIPRWMPQSLWFAGWVFMCWTCFILIVRVVVAMAARNYALVIELAGIASADEEARQESASAEALHLNSDIVGR